MSRFDLSSDRVLRSRNFSLLKFSQGLRHGRTSPYNFEGIRLELVSLKKNADSHSISEFFLVPGSMHIAHVPVFKKGDHKIPQNYGPVPIASICPKILEQVV